MTTANEKRICILLVDDEETIHRALERTLRREPYDILHAYDAGEAEAILVQHPEVRAIICDHYMTGTPGLDFLLHVRRTRPAIVAILLTAQADLAMVMAALNEGRLHRFFTKPWDGGDLRSSLRSLLGIPDAGDDTRRLRAIQSEDERIRRQLVPQQDADGAFVIEPPG